MRLATYEPLAINPSTAMSFAQGHPITPRHSTCRSHSRAHARAVTRPPSHPRATPHTPAGCGSSSPPPGCPRFRRRCTTQGGVAISPARFAMLTAASVPVVRRLWPGPVIGWRGGVTWTPPAREPRRPAPRRGAVAAIPRSVRRSISGLRPWAVPGKRR